MTIISKSLKSTGISVKCSYTTLKNLWIPLCFLLFLGFLINTQVTFVPNESFQTCLPRTDIAFLKTHKCAGSSVQNILMRYGDRNNLTFVLPEKGNYLGHPMPFSPELLPTVPSFPVYNILAHHTRLDHDAIMSVMSSDTVFISIVRDPVQVFESSFVYYGLDKFFAGNLHQFTSVVPRLNRNFLNRRYSGKFGINQMMFDLGADPDIFYNDTLVTNYVNQLDSWFDLVLVAERMDESLILLKHLLCWSTDDVVVFKLNARSEIYRSQLSQLEISTLRTLNNADQMLYDHFAAKLDDLIRNFGLERMDSEVAELKDRISNWYEFCVKGEETKKTPPSTPKYYFNPRVLVLEPRDNINNNTCSVLTMEELPYTDYLRDRQMVLYNQRAAQIAYNSSHGS